MDSVRLRGYTGSTKCRPSFVCCLIFPENKRELKKLRRFLQRKRHITIKLCFLLGVLRLFHQFVTLYETGEVHFCLFGTNGFYVKAENEKLSLQPCVVVRTSNMKTSRRPLGDYVRDCTKKRAARAA